MLSDPQIGILGIVLFFLLLLVRAPVWMSMALSGSIGILILDKGSLISTVGNEIFAVSSKEALIALPLFILMGNLFVLSGISKDLYSIAFRSTQKLRGGLAHTTILSSAFFSALSGSSLASAITMGKIAVPEMRRYKYKDSIIGGSVAAGGTLGILIPPSTGLIIYSIFTEVSIGKLFVAALVPSIIMVAVFFLVVWVLTKIYPDISPEVEEKIPDPLSLLTVIYVIATWFIVIGGIYLGWLTILESATIGIVSSLILAGLRRKLGSDVLHGALSDTLEHTGMIFLLIMGAFIFIPFIGLSGIPGELLGYLSTIDLKTYYLVPIILLIFIFLGAFMEGFSVLILTIPLIQPLLEAQGVDLVWFGILMVITLEMGLISPPLGMNIFVVKKLMVHTSLGELYKANLPFLMAMGIVILALLLFPSLVLF